MCMWRQYYSTIVERPASTNTHTHTFIDLPAALSKQHCKEWVVLLFLNSSARARNLVLCIACTHNPKSRHPKPEKEQTNPDTLSHGPPPYLASKSS